MPSDFDVTNTLKMQAENGQNADVRGPREMTSRVGVTTDASSLRCPINVSAAYSYLSALTREQGELSQELSRAQSVLQRYVATLASDPERAINASPAPQDKPLLNLVGMIVSKDAELQEQIAVDLTNRTRVVRTAEAVDELKSYCDTLPRVFQESNEPGRALMRYVCELAVNLTTSDNISPATSRLLAKQNIYAPDGVLTPRGAKTLSSLLSATVDFIRANQPDVIACLGRNAGRIIAPSVTEAEIGEYIRTALQDMPLDDDTYLNIFKNGPEFIEDETAERIATRVSNLINKAAGIAREAHLIGEQSDSEPQNIRNLTGREQQISQELAQAQTHNSAYEEECNRQVERLYRSLEEPSTKASPLEYDANGNVKTPSSTSKASLDGAIPNERVVNMVATKVLTDAIEGKATCDVMPAGPTQNNQANAQSLEGKEIDNATPKAASDIDLISEFENFSLPETGGTTGAPLTKGEAARINSILSEAVARAEQSNLFGATGNGATNPVIDAAVAQAIRGDEPNELSSNQAPNEVKTAQAPVSNSLDATSVASKVAQSVTQQAAEALETPLEKSNSMANLGARTLETKNQALAEEMADIELEGARLKNEMPFTGSELKPKPLDETLENANANQETALNKVDAKVDSKVAEASNISAAEQANPSLEPLVTEKPEAVPLENNEPSPIAPEVLNQAGVNVGGQALTDSNTQATLGNPGSNLSGVNPQALKKAADALQAGLHEEPETNDSLKVSLPVSSIDASAEEAVSNEMAEPTESKAPQTSSNINQLLDDELLKAVVGKTVSGIEASLPLDEASALTSNLAPNNQETTELANSSLVSKWQEETQGNATNITSDSVTAKAQNSLLAGLNEGDGEGVRSQGASSIVMPTTSLNEAEAKDSSLESKTSSEPTLEVKEEPKITPSWLAGIKKRAAQNLAAGAMASGDSTPKNLEAVAPKEALNTKASPNDAVSPNAKASLANNQALNGKTELPHLEVDPLMADDLSAPGVVKIEPDGPEATLTSKDATNPQMMTKGENDKVSAVINKRYGTSPNQLLGAEVTATLNEAAIDDSEAINVQGTKQSQGLGETKEGGILESTPNKTLFGRLAGLFKKHQHEDVALARDRANAKELESVALASNVQAEKVLLDPTKAVGLSMDDMVAQLKTLIQDPNVAPEVRKMATSIHQAMTNPLGDLQAVSAWLGLVTAPLNASGPRAAAMQQWALMLLSLRFRQLGKNVDKFTKSEAFNKMLSGVKVSGQEKWPQSMLDETMGQIERLQTLSASGGELGLPSYIPLPPSYPQGREGGLNVEKGQTEEGLPEWKLSFFFELPKLGPLQVKTAVSGADIKLSFVAEKTQALAKIAQTAPVLRARLDECGFKVTKLTPRLGKVYPPGESNQEVMPANVKWQAKHDGLNLNV